MKNLPVKLNLFLHRQTTASYNIPRRTITDHELVFILDGKGKIEIENKIYDVKQGELYYFSPNLKHSLWVEKAPFMCFYAIHFSLPENIKSLDIPHVFKPNHPHKIEQLMRELEQTYNAKPYLHEWRENVLLELLLCEIHAQKATNATPTQTMRIQKVLEMIHSSPYCEFTVEQLAHTAQMKRSCFMQAFKHVTGTSPIRYSSQLKIQHSQSLLLETTLQISEIAKKCGFEDALYFSRLFKERTGCSPKAYRQQYSLL